MREKKNLALICEFLSLGLPFGGTNMFFWRMRASLGLACAQATTLCSQVFGKANPRSRAVLLCVWLRSYGHFTSPTPCMSPRGIFNKTHPSLFLLFTV